MTHQIPFSSVWSAPWPGLEAALTRAVDRGMENAVHDSCVYFRADDIGVPGQQNTALFHTFQEHGTPLSAAVVPAWLTHKRWQHLQQLTQKTPHLWAWHQHGWRHSNHEPAGLRKCECGNARGKAVIQDIQQGADRLRQLMGETFVPVFTPPWNRMSTLAFPALAPAGLMAVSRADTAHSVCPDTFPDFMVHLDLHTRRATCPQTDQQALLMELEKGLATGLSGIMLHHQRMNTHALHFLHVLLKLFAVRSRIQTVHFGHLLENMPAEK